MEKKKNMKSLNFNEDNIKETSQSGKTGFIPSPVPKLPNTTEIEESKDGINPIFTGDEDEYDEFFEYEYNEIMRRTNKDFYHIVWTTHYAWADKVKKFNTITNPEAEAVILDENNRKEVYNHLVSKIQKEKYDVQAINVLGNHVHCLLYCYYKDIEDIVKNLKGYSSYMFNKNKEKDCTLWGKKFNIAYIRNLTHLEMAVKYIKNNHIKHNLPSIYDSSQSGKTGFIPSPVPQLPDTTEIEGNKENISGKTGFIPSPLPQLPNTTEIEGNKENISGKTGFNPSPVPKLPDTTEIEGSKDGINPIFTGDENILSESEPYLLPNGWKWVKLGEVAEIKGGKRLPKGHDYVNYKTKHPYIRVTDFLNMEVDTSQLKYISEETYNLIKNYTINTNDLYISIAGTIGKVGIIPTVLNNANLTENAAKITNIKEISYKFLCYLLNSKLIQEIINEKSVSTTQPKLALFRIETLPIPLPPLEEQQRIVEKLESVLGKLKEAKELIEEARESFELRKASILNQAFTGKLTEKWRESNIEHSIENEKISGKTGFIPSPVPKLPDTTEIDGSKDESEPYLLPNGWKWVKLGEVAENLQYGYTDKTKDNGNAKYLRITDIQDNNVDWESVPFCQIEENRKKQYLLKENDIVIARTGATTGKSFLIKKVDNSVFASYLIRLSLQMKKVNVQFVWYFMQSEFYWNQITEVSSGIAQPGVNATKLSNLIFPLPPLEEQQKIVEILESLLNKEEEVKILLDMEEQIELLEKSILSMAFKGELIK